MPNPAIDFIQKQKTINIRGWINFKPVIHPIILIVNKSLIINISFIPFIMLITPLDSIDIPHFSIQFQKIIHIGSWINFISISRFCKYFSVNFHRVLGIYVGY